MTKPVKKEYEESQSISHVLFLSTLLVLPGALWALFGWISSIIPLIIFTFIQKYGWSYTSRKIVIAIFAASCVSLFFQTLELTLFSATMMPAGYAIALSAQKQEKPWLAGFKGALTFTASLSFFFCILLANSEVSFFFTMTESLNSAIEEAFALYRQSGNLSAENHVILEETYFQIKTVVPRILPAILAGFIIIQTWVTLLLGNIILPKLGRSRPWPRYQYWSLPDKLIWGLIISGIMALIPEETLRLCGINGLIVFAFLFCIQGLAILVFLLNKWNIPKMMRSIIYLVIILQSFGTVILLGTGIANVWFDLRKLISEQNNDKKEAK